MFKLKTCHTIPFILIKLDMSCKYFREILHFSYGVYIILYVYIPLSNRLKLKSF